MDNLVKSMLFSCLTFMPIGDSIIVYLMMKGQKHYGTKRESKIRIESIKRYLQKRYGTRSEINDLVKK